jgi:hypothetical protein
MSSDQGNLLAIVETWSPSDEPEFRGFRCANCKEYFSGRAWHYLLHEGGYITPVHFCVKCKCDFETSALAEKQRIPVDRSRFKPIFSEAAESTLGDISHTWNLASEPVYKDFTCDFCGKPLPDVKAYHVWRNDAGTLVEYHFDRACGDRILQRAIPNI